VQGPLRRVSDEDPRRRVRAVNEYKPTADVQLTDQDLERARRLMAQARSSMRQAQEHLAELGGIVLGALNEDGTAGTVDVSRLLDDASDEGSVKVCYYDHNTGACLGCMVDPPGISRPCKDDKPGPKSPGPVYFTLSR
jgi:hypothetical protein